MYTRDIIYLRLYYIIMVASNLHSITLGKAFMIEYISKYVNRMRNINKLI